MDRMIESAARLCGLLNRSPNFDWANMALSLGEATLADDWSGIRKLANIAKELLVVAQCWQDWQAMPAHTTSGFAIMRQKLIYWASRVEKDIAASDSIGDTFEQCGSAAAGCRIDPAASRNLARQLNVFASRFHCSPCHFSKRVDFVNPLDLV